MSKAKMYLLVIGRNNFYGVQGFSVAATPDNHQKRIGICKVNFKALMQLA